MAARLTFKLNENVHSKDFFLNDARKPHILWPGIKPHNVLSIELNGVELQYAIETLGAANVKKSEATYFGDEACRIFFNW